MRNNKVGGKNLRIFTEYEYSGCNGDNFINSVRRRDITVIDVKKGEKKGVRFKIKYSDNKKFFAFTEKMCYNNIRRIKDCGRDYPILFFINNVGLIIGAVVFIIISAFCGDLVFGIDYSGSGKVYRREVEEFLTEEGVKKFSRFSGINLDSLSDSILADNPHLNFVSCEKNGNRLIINLIKKENGKDVLSGNAKFLKAEFDGEIAELKVYRGTAVKQVGDLVKKGDVIVDGYAVIKENVVSLNVIASVKIRREFVYDYDSENDNEEERAKILAENLLDEREIEKVGVLKTQIGKKYNYRVIINYLVTESVG